MRTHTPTCTRYLSTVHAILPYACMRVWSVGLCEWLGTGNKPAGRKGSRKKKDANASAAAYCTVLHCTALHGLALHGRVVVSPRLAWPRIASLRPVKMIPTYLLPLLPSAGQSPRRLLTLHYLYVAYLRCCSVSLSSLSSSSSASHDYFTCT